MSGFLKRERKTTIPSNQRPFSLRTGTIGHVVNFTGGSLSEQNVGFVSAPSVENLSVDSYLHLKLSRGSNEIESLQILNEEEVLEVKSENDKMFDIFLPVLKEQESSRQLYYYGILNLVLDQNIDKCVSYKNGGKVHVTPFLIKGYDRIKKVIKRQEINAQDCIFLDFSAGNINTADEAIDSINPQKADIIQGAKTDGGLTAGLEERIEEEDFVVGCLIKIPLAFKNNNGEVVNCQQGSVDIRLSPSTTFSTEFGDENYFLIPDFEKTGSSSSQSDLKDYYPL